MDKVAGVILLVEDIDESVDFYKKLGFEVAEERPDIATVMKLEDFWVELLIKDKVVSPEYREDIEKSDKGSGIYLQVQVKAIDQYYDAIVKKGIRPAGKPENFPWGQREFIVVDPNGYKIAFFTQIK